jgi:hypothetical protein
MPGWREGGRGGGWVVRVRTYGAPLTLALMARSLLHGDPIDLSGLAHVELKYAAIAAAAFAKRATRGV